MGLDPLLAPQLLALDLDPAAASLAAQLTGLGQDIRRSVPSLHTVSILLAEVPGEMAVELEGSADRILASLAMPVSDDAAPALLVLRAGRSGAFLLLADDLAIHAANARIPEIDQHLSLDPSVNAALVSAALIDRRWMSIATGVLLAQGFTPEEAAAHLQLLADSAGVPLPAAARSVAGKWAPPDAFDG
jgi:hypothetical protein